MCKGVPPFPGFRVAVVKCSSRGRCAPRALCVPCPAYVLSAPVPPCASLCLPVPPCLSAFESSLFVFLVVLLGVLLMCFFPVPCAPVPLHYWSLRRPVALPSITRYASSLTHYASSLTRYASSPTHYASITRYASPPLPSSRPQDRTSKRSARSTSAGVRCRSPSPCRGLWCRAMGCRR